MYLRSGVNLESKKEGGFIGKFLLKVHKSMGVKFSFSDFILHVFIK